MMLKYLSTKYQVGARGPHSYDCYGLVRAVRQEIGKPLMGDYADVSPMDKRRMTAEHDSVVAAEALTLLPGPVHGAIACAWVGRLCVHVGIVMEADNRLWVMETDVGTGPCMSDINQFEKRFTKVEYYD